MSLLLTATLLLLAPQSPPPPPRHALLTNSFITATETVIDLASTIDLALPDADFAPRMAQLRTANANLQALAQQEASEAASETQPVLDATNDLLFGIAACHIATVANTPTQRCQASIARARFSAMDAIHHHKENGAWVEGPPAP